MKIKHISHVAIYGKDMVQLKRFYSEVLGLSVSAEEDYEGVSSLCFLQVGDAEMEIVTPTSVGNSFDQKIDEEGGGINHIAFEVEDLDDAIRELKKKNYIEESATAFNGAQGSRVIFLDKEKTGNVSIELVESAG